MPLGCFLAVAVLYYRIRIILLPKRLRFCIVLSWIGLTVCRREDCSKNCWTNFHGFLDGV